MKRIAVLLTPVIVLVACARAPGASSRVTTTPAPDMTTTSSPTASLSATIPTAKPFPSFLPTPTIDPETRPAETTPEPTPTYAPCPTSFPTTVDLVQNADPACFAGGAEVRAWIGGVPAVGWEGPARIEPGWLVYPTNNAGLWSAPAVADTDGYLGCPETQPECVVIFLHASPDSGLRVDARPRWVIVTGHTNDPAAADCHYVFVDGWTDPTDQPVPIEQTVAFCARAFVVTAIRDAP